MIGEVTNIGETMANEAVSVSAGAEEQAASVIQISVGVSSLTDQSVRLQELLDEFRVSSEEKRMLP